MRLSWLIGVLTVTVVLSVIAFAEDKPVRPAEEPPHWAFVAPKRPALPRVQHTDWAKNPIDYFVLERLEEHGLVPNPPADKLTWLRRVTFDLTGLPPTIEEQEAFLQDTSPLAWERVVDRLLASPHYGERAAQFWLDLVRYAETDGFRADDHRPEAYRYRDYVIRAFNADLPYNRFIQQQLAGDELEPNNFDALIATGFLRLWPDEFNAVNLEQRWQEILDDVTEVTGLAFLGLTVGCARCHDHKYDPTTQLDYYRLQAFFAAMLPRDDLVLASAEERERYQTALRQWQTAAQPILAQMEELIAPKRNELRQRALERFHEGIQKAVLTPREQRTPYQMQIAALAEKQLERAMREAPSRMTGPQKEKYQRLAEQLERLPVSRPAQLPTIMGVCDVETGAAPTYRLAHGDWRKPKEEVQPGFPHFLPQESPNTTLPPGVRSTGRRAALARWLTRSDHPLTARVMVNRLWQQHFGTGIVASANDFGIIGEPPSHPALLDWLAVELVEQGWSLKHIHRLICTSATYRQSSFVDFSRPQHRSAQEADPQNRLLWHYPRWRLEGEALRDAMLVCAGELNRRMFGPSARPELPPNISRQAWKPDPQPEARHRRSIYVYRKRNLKYPLFEAFDQPDMFHSCARRARTTTAPQALCLLNGELARSLAFQWAARLLPLGGGDDAARIERAWREALARSPSQRELSWALEFLRETQKFYSDEKNWPADWREPLRHHPQAAHLASLAELCLALFNLNEFAYID
ncbi:MAG: DUF1553 domain-containing protein [Gemmatales bacterium]|nr:DUF1553 domain-containing protein [Gemmatales bacterium]